MEDKLSVITNADPEPNLKLLEPDKAVFKSALVAVESRITSWPVLIYKDSLATKTAPLVCFKDLPSKKSNLVNKALALSAVVPTAKTEFLPTPISPLAETTSFRPCVTSFKATIVASSPYSGSSNNLPPLRSKVPTSKKPLSCSLPTLMEELVLVKVILLAVKLSETVMDSAVMSLVVETAPSATKVLVKILPLVDNLPP